MEHEIRTQLLSLNSNRSSGASPEHDDQDDVVAKAERRKQQLHATYDKLKQFNSAPTSSKRVCLELLILATEIALSMEEYSLAKDAVEEFFLEAKSKDQLYCRGLFAEALILNSEALATSGSESIDVTLRAISQIDRAVEICMDEGQRPTYDFLVYNASVHLWKVIRPLLRKNLRSFAVPGLTRIVEALAQTGDESFEWRGRLSMTLALALEEQGETAKAQQMVKSSVELLQEATNRLEDSPDIGKKQTVAKVLNEATRLSVHLGKQGSLGIAKADKAKGDLASTLQCIRSSVIQGQDAIRKELEECLPIILTTSDDDKTTEVKDVTSLIEIGRLATRHKLFDIAKRCVISSLKVSSRAKSAHDEVLLDLLRAEWLAEAPNSSFDIFNGKSFDGPSPISTPPVVLAKRIQAMKTIERAILTCARLDNPSLLEDGCLLAWNVSLPLLQPHLRKHIHKAFQTAANALEEIDSPLTELRAHLHSEVAKCEVASDFLTKASSQVEKALSLDYNTTTNEKEDPEERKPNSLREFLEPLQNKLRLKSNLYQEPETKFEQAILLVEQVKDAKEAHLKSSLLSRAITLLESSDDFVEQQEQIQPKQDNKLVTLLWGEIAKLAWEQRLLDLTGTAVDRVIAMSSTDDSKQPELQRLSAEIHFIQAETFAERIQMMPLAEDTPLVVNLTVKALGMQVPAIVTPPVDWDEEEAFTHNITGSEEMELIWPIGLPPPYNQQLLEEFKLKVIESILGALHIGLSLGEQWMVENAVTYLWNYHLHMFNGPIQRLQFALPSLIGALSKAHSALSTLNEETRNPQLFCAISLALALGLEAVAKQQDGEDSGTSDEDAEILGKSSADKFSKAVEVCKAGIAFTQASLEDRKELFSVLHRVQRCERKTTEPLSSDPLEAAFSVIELLKLDVVSTTEKQTLLNNCIGNLESAMIENHLIALEVWTRVGREAFDLHDSNSSALAEKCASRTMSLLSDQQQESIQPNAWRWYSLAECLWGCVVAAQAEAILHDKTTQDSLRQEALKHFASAAEHGAKSKLSRLVLDSARELWNVAVHLMGSSATRSMLFVPLKKVLEHLDEVQERAEMTLRVSLYCALFEIFKDKSDWNGGLAAVDNAFRIVPQHLQKRLWEARVIFSSKLNKDVAAGLHKIKEGNKSLQAKAWATLARSSTKIEDQLNAYVQALDLLKDSFERAEYFVEFAEWLRSTHFPRDDVIQCLLSAADIILDVQTASDAADVAAAAAAAVAATENDGTSTVLRAGSPVSVQSHTSKRTQRTTRSQVTSAMSRQHEVMKLGDPCYDAPERVDFGLKLKLVQIFTMLARAVDKSSTRHDMLMVAHQHLSEAWSKFLFVVPSEEVSVLEGSLFERILACAEDKIRAQYCGEHHLPTTDKISLLLHYLLELGDMLQESGQHLLSVSSYAMMEFISLSLGDEQYRTLAVLKLCHNLFQLNLNHLAGVRLSRVSFELEEETRSHYAIEVEQILEQRKNELVKEEDETDIDGGDSAKLQPIKRKVIERLKIREVWAKLAQAMVNLGYIFPAKRLLGEVKQHNKAYKDHENIVRTLLIEAKILLIEGKDELALSSTLDVMSALRKSKGGDVVAWLEALKLTRCCLLSLEKGFETKSVLAEAVEVFKGLRRHGADFDSEVALSYLETFLAEEVLHDVKQRATGGSSKWRTDWKTWEEHLKHGQDCILIATKPDCAHVATIDILVKQCSQYMQMYQTREIGMEKLCFEKIVDGLSRASQCAEAMVQMIRPGVTEALKGSLEISPGRVSLPVERMLGNIQVLLGTVELMYHSLLNPPKSLDELKVEEAKLAGLDCVDRYLMETAPEKEATLDEILPDAKIRACGHFMGAYAQFHSVSSLRAKGLLAAGTGLARVKDSTQAKTLLCEAVDTAIAGKQFQVAGLASYELTRLDMLSSCCDYGTLKSLLLYQSCKNNQWMMDMLSKEICDKRSKLSCFLRLRDHIVNELGDPKSDVDGWAYTQCEEYLETSVAMKRLDCSKPVDCILREMPATATFLVLTISPDESTLLMSCFTKENRKECKVVPYHFGGKSLGVLKKLVGTIDSYRKRLNSYLLAYSQDRQFDYGSSGVEDRLNLELESILVEIRKVLGPALDKVLGVPAEKEEGKPKTDLVIVADEVLGRLPLEGLIDKTRFASCCRDFSVHMFDHRLSNVCSNTSSDGENDVDLTIPNRPALVKYVLDPLNEEKELVDGFNEFKKPNWSGLVGTEGIPSRGSWQGILGREGESQFLYLGLGPFLSQIEPSALPGLDLRKSCSVSFLLDRASNDISFRQQNRRESKLKPSQRQLEQPYMAAALLSMCGVNVVVLNQWTNSVSTNVKLASDFVAKNEKDKVSSIVADCVLRNPEFKTRVQLNTIVFGLPGL